MSFQEPQNALQVQEEPRLQVPVRRSIFTKIKNGVKSGIYVHPDTIVY
jgi:hypothetical protein